jgi:hypothetical protein
MKNRNNCSLNESLKIDNCQQLPNDKHLKINWETYEVHFGHWNIGTLKKLIVINNNGDEQIIELSKPIY